MKLIAKIKQAIIGCWQDFKEDFSELSNYGFRGRLIQFLIIMFLGLAAFGVYQLVGKLFFSPHEVTAEKTIPMEERDEADGIEDTAPEDYSALLEYFRETTKDNNNDVSSSFDSESATKKSELEKMKASLLNQMKEDYSNLENSYNSVIADIYASKETQRNVNRIYSALNDEPSDAFDSLFWGDWDDMTFGAIGVPVAKFTFGIVVGIAIFLLLIWLIKVFLWGIGSIIRSLVKNSGKVKTEWEKAKSEALANRPIEMKPVCNSKDLDLESNDRKRTLEQDLFSENFKITSIIYTKDFEAGLRKALDYDDKEERLEILEDTARAFLEKGDKLKELIERLNIEARLYGLDSEFSDSNESEKKSIPVTHEDTTEEDNKCITPEIKDIPYLIDKVKSLLPNIPKWKMPKEEEWESETNEEKKALCKDIAVYNYVFDNINPKSSYLSYISDKIRFAAIAEALKTIYNKEEIIKVLKKSRSWDIRCEIDITDDDIIDTAIFQKYDNFFCHEIYSNNIISYSIYFNYDMRGMNFYLNNSFIIDLRDFILKYGDDDVVKQIQFDDVLVL